MRIADSRDQNHSAKRKVAGRAKKIDQSDDKLSFPPAEEENTDEPSAPASYMAKLKFEGSPPYPKLLELTADLKPITIPQQANGSTSITQYEALHRDVVAFSNSCKQISELSNKAIQILNGPPPKKGTLEYQIRTVFDQTFKRLDIANLNYVFETIFTASTLPPESLSVRYVSTLNGAIFPSNGSSGFLTGTGLTGGVTSDRERAPFWTTRFSGSAQSAFLVLNRALWLSHCVTTHKELVDFQSTMLKARASAEKSIKRFYAADLPASPSADSSPIKKRTGQCVYKTETLLTLNSLNPLIGRMSEELSGACENVSAELQKVIEYIGQLENALQQNRVANLDEYFRPVVKGIERYLRYWEKFGNALARSKVFEEVAI